MNTTIKSEEDAVKWVSIMMDNCSEVKQECHAAMFEAFPAKNKAAEIICDAADKLWNLGFRLFNGTVGKDFEDRFKEIDESTTKKLEDAGFNEENEFVKKLKNALTISI